MMKKSFAVILLLLLYGFNVTAAEINLSTVGYENDSAIISVTGMGSEFAKSDILALEILRQGKTVEDLSLIAPETAFEILAYLKDNIECQNEGVFQHEFHLPDLNAEYLLRLRLKSGGIITHSFTVLEQAYLDNMTKLVMNSGSASELRQRIESDSAVFFDLLDIIGALKKDENKLLVYNAVFSHRKEIKNFIALKEIIQLNVIAQMINEAESAEVILRHITEYGGSILADPPIYEIYNEITSGKAKENLANKLMTLSVEDYDALVSFARDEIILSTIEHMPNWSGMAGFWGKAYCLTGIEDSLYETYQKIKDTYNIDSQMAGKRYSNLEGVYAEFKKLVSQETQKKVTESTPARTGGPGGAVIVTPPVNIQNETTENKTGEPSVFDDLEGFDWAKESILALHREGAAAGREKNKFYPAENITRAEYVKLLIEALAYKNENAAAYFIDCQKEDWAYIYVASAYERGIVTGYGNNLFGHGDPITREDMAVLAYRAAEIPANEYARLFTDDELISGYAAEAVYAMRALQIINGRENNKFEPKAYATRAEAAKIICGILNYVRSEVW